MGLSRLFRRGGKDPDLPAPARDALGVRRGERVLAAACDERTGDYVVATTTKLAVVGEDGTLRLHRPWHEVGAGAWEPQTQTISVTWADGGRAAQWTLAGSGGGERLAEVFYERVATSVLIDAPVEIEERVLGRVAIRRDLESGDLVRQITWSRGVGRDDAGAHHHAEVLLDDLAEQAGLS